MIVGGNTMINATEYIGAMAAQQPSPRRHVPPRPNSREQHLSLEQTIPGRLPSARNDLQPARLCRGECGARAAIHVSLDCVLPGEPPAKAPHRGRRDCALRGSGIAAGD